MISRIVWLWVQGGDGFPQQALPPCRDLARRSGETHEELFKALQLGNSEKHHDPFSGDPSLPGDQVVTSPSPQQHSEQLNHYKLHQSLRSSVVDKRNLVTLFIFFLSHIPVSLSSSWITTEKCPFPCGYLRTHAQLLSMDIRELQGEIGSSHLKHGGKKIHWRRKKNRKEIHMLSSYPSLIHPCRHHPCRHTDFQTFVIIHVHC